MSKNEINIFIPAYNEEGSIGALIDEIKACGYTNVYIIDDGSYDQTSQEASKVGAQVVHHFINLGVGAATQTAIELAKRESLEYMVLLDGDGQHLPADIALLMQEMEGQNVDLVIGSRFLGDFSKMPMTRKLFNRMANTLTNMFCINRYTDTQSGFRLMNRKAIENLQLSVNDYGFCSEMIIQAERNQLKVREVPIRTVYTSYSMSKGQDFFTGIKTAFSLVWKVIHK